MTVLKLSEASEFEYALNGGAWQRVTDPVPVSIASLGEDAVAIRGIGMPVQIPELSAPVMLFPTPESLFSNVQADFAETAHIDLRSNWTVAQGDLREVVGNGSSNDVCFTFDQPLTAGRAHVALWNTVTGTTGTYRA